MISFFKEYEQVFEENKIMKKKVREASSSNSSEKGYYEEVISVLARSNLQNVEYAKRCEQYDSTFKEISDTLKQTDNNFKVTQRSLETLTGRMHHIHRRVLLDLVREKQKRHTPRLLEILLRLLWPHLLALSAKCSKHYFQSTLGEPQRTR